MGFRRPCLRRMYFHPLACLGTGGRERTGYRDPPNASMVRNIMQAVLYMHDHTVHFYQLHALDWVDVVSALKADPKAAALLAQQLSPWAKNTEGISPPHNNG